MKMRRSRQRKRIINIRQSGGWNAGASSVPSYESFTMLPTPRGFPANEAPGDTTVDMSLTGRKRRASDAEHVQEPISSEALLQPAPVERGDCESDIGCQQSPDGGAGSTRPRVKQIVVKLSGLRQLAATSRESLSANHSEPVKDMGTETECQQETQRSVRSNAADCSGNRQNNHFSNCSHADFLSSQHANAKPTVRIPQQALQTPGERQPMEEPAKTHEEGRPKPSVSGENSGGCLGNLAPIDESCCVPVSRCEEARSGFEHDYPARSAGCFSHPANPSWMPNTNVCRSCPNAAISGCHACASTRFTSPCSFQRGVPRAVRYYIEPASLSEIKCFPRRIEAPACCQRMDFEGAQPPVMYAPAMKPGVDPHLHAGRGRNLVLPSRSGEPGHTCGTHYISGDEVLVCPAPWVHKGRIFPGVPAMCVDPKEYGSMGVNWTPEGQSEAGQAKPSDLKQEESSIGPEMPDPVFPPAYCNNRAPNFAADLDMDIQRHLEEQIAHEILLLSQKLANLQTRYGARRVANDNSTKPAVLSCPQTPLLLDNPMQRDAKSNARAQSISHTLNEETRPATSSSSRSTHRNLDSRSQLEERRLGGRHVGSTKGAPASVSSNRGSGSGTTAAFFHANRNHPSSRASSGPQTSGNSRASSTHSRATEASLVQRWGKVFKESVQAATKASNKPRTACCSKGRERELVDQECSYSDDMKECHSRTVGTNVQGYPDGNKRFDWVKTLRFGGVSVRENQGPCAADFASQMDGEASSPQKEFTDIDAETWLRDTSEQERLGCVPTSVSKSVQADGRQSPEGRVDNCARTCSADRDDRLVDRPDSRPKRWPDNISSVENRFGKPGKRFESPDETGVLDSRLAHHLVKAGLRRAPSFWRVPGIRPVPNANMKVKKMAFGSRSPRKDGGKRLRRRILFEPKSSPGSEHVPSEEKGVEREENASQQCELEVEIMRECVEATTDTLWQKEVGDYEAEYETFVENTSDVGLQHNNVDSEEYTSVVNREEQTIVHSEEDHGPKLRRPSSCISTQEKARLAEVPVVSLTKQPLQATRKTFIRCIELVVATKKKNQLSKLNGRKASEMGYSSHRRVLECSERPSSTKDVCGMDKESSHVTEGSACEDTQAMAEEQAVRKPTYSPECNSYSTAVAVMETQEANCNESGEDSIAGTADGNLASQQHLEHISNNNTACSPKELQNGPGSSDMTVAGPDCSNSRVEDQVSSLASILSRVMPKQMDSMETEQLTACVREIFDALEKERLGLPKIKTSGRKTGVTTRANSPRDSGGVKRIAEQVKSTPLRAPSLDKAEAAKKDEDALGDAKPHWSNIQHQKQAVVF